MANRPLCPCGKPVRSNGNTRTKKSNPSRKWDSKCYTCRWGTYTKHKKDKCEFCGFVPVHSSQLDVDHIDGNRGNNDISNLQTLCANCHRLKTYVNKDFAALRVLPEIEDNEWRLDLDA